MNWTMIAQQAFLQKNRTAARSTVRYSKRVARWRRLCLERDRYACVLCHSLHEVEVHHLERWIDAPLKRLTVANGATLCRQCHQLGHGALGAAFPPDLTQRIRNAIKGQREAPDRRKQVILYKKYFGITMPDFY